MRGPATDDSTPSYLSRRSRARHSVFGTHSCVTERTLAQHGWILDAIAQAQGRSVSAGEINQYLLKHRGSTLLPHTLYRGLKYLLEDGQLTREWFGRNGRASALYRLPAQGPGTRLRARLVCLACARTVELRPDEGAWFAALSEACEANGMALPSEPLTIGTTCRDCG